MGLYEYKVVPAPAKGRKARGVRKSEDKFAFALQELMNTYANDGWEFLRSETLPNEERTGLTSFNTTYRSILVFRRTLKSQTETASDLAATQLQPPVPTQKRLPKPVAEVVENEDDFFEDTEILPKASNLSSLPIALQRRAENYSIDKDVAAE